VDDEFLKIANRRLGGLAILLGIPICYFQSLNLIDILMMYARFFLLVFLAGFTFSSLRLKKIDFFSSFYSLPFLLWFYYWCYLEENFMIGFWLLIVLNMVALCLNLVYLLVTRRK